MPTSVRLAMAQMLVEGGRRDSNLARACVRISEAATSGAQIIVLPEALDLGWTHPSALAGAEPIPGGKSCEQLRAAARQHGLFVCAGLTERAGKDVFNAAVLLSPEGELLLHHRKLNELEIGRVFYGRGNRLGVVATPLGTLGVMICADAFAPGEMVSRTLGLIGASLILSPCAWAVPADHDNVREPYGQLWRDCYGSVARDFKLWIAGASNVGPITGGPWAGRHCIGNSLLVGPGGANRGRPAHMRVESEALLVAEVTLEPPPSGSDEGP